MTDNKETMHDPIDSLCKQPIQGEQPRLEDNLQYAVMYTEPQRMGMNDTRQYAVMKDNRRYAKMYAKPQRALMKDKPLQEVMIDNRQYALMKDKPLQEVMRDKLQYEVMSLTLISAIIKNLGTSEKRDCKARVQQIRNRRQLRETKQQSQKKEEPLSKDKESQLIRVEPNAEEYIIGTQRQDEETPPVSEENILLWRLASKYLEYSIWLQIAMLVAFGIFLFLKLRNIHTPVPLVIIWMITVMTMGTLSALCSRKARKLQQQYIGNNETA